MLDLITSTKPVLDEITGQNVRTWHSGPSVLAANWQVPKSGSRIWRAGTLTTTFTHDVTNQLMYIDQQDPCQLQYTLDRFPWVQSGMHAQADRGGWAFVIIVDHLGVAPQPTRSISGLPITVTIDTLPGCRSHPPSIGAIHRYKPVNHIQGFRLVSTGVQD